MKALNHAELQALEASDAQKFEAINISLWREADIDLIKAEREAAEVSTLPAWPIRALYNTCLIVFGFAFFGVALVMTWTLRAFEWRIRHVPKNSTVGHKAFVFFSAWADHVCKFMPMQEQRWRSQSINPAGIYMRNWVKTQAPPVVVETMERIRTVFSKTEFEVMFYGTDPILVCYVPHEDGRRRYYPLVWDEIDGEVIVLKPPT